MVENSPTSTEASDSPDPVPDDLVTPTASSTLFWNLASPFLNRLREEDNDSNNNDTMADVSAADGTAAPSSTMTMEQVMILINNLQAKTTSSNVTSLVLPRHGSISDTGVWTGMGASGTGLRPFSKNCMRAFKTDPIKNHQHMHPIEDKCKLGLRDYPELHFSLNHEPNAQTIVTSIRAFEKFIASCGMDGVFTIIDSNLASVNLLQTPGMVTQANIDLWCTDVLDKGVWGRTAGSDAIVRLPVCQYDLVNMDWSAEAVLNSCTPALRYDLENKVAIHNHNGPKLMMTLLTMLYRPSLSKLKVLRGKLEALDIRTYPGENVTLFCHDASKLVTEIRMNFMPNAAVDDLTSVALTGLHHSSEELIRFKVRQISMDNDVNGFEGSVGNDKADALEVLKTAEDMYLVLVNMKGYAPAKPIEKKTGMNAYQAGTSDKLQQDRTASSAGRNHGRPTGVCWDCQSKDHFRGDPSCPKLGTPPPAGGSSGGSAPGISRHGLDDATSAEVLVQSTLMFKTMPPRENIPDEAEYNIVVGGKIVAKYCRHCGRFVKGGSQHYTKDHTGTRSVFAYQGPATSTPAPAIMAALANLSPAVPVDLTDVPKVDSKSFLFRHQTPTNYDFGSMGGGPAPHANLARASLDAHINSLLDSEDSDTHANLFAALVNEFGG